MTKSLRSNYLKLPRQVKASIWFLICSFMNFIAFFVKDDKNKETIKQKQTLDTGETSVEWEISPETSKPELFMMIDSTRNLIR